jgi:phage repressor protein C with HTH and peptisase S24 domain
MGFGTEIKRLRNDAKVSANKLANLIGIDSERLRKWEQRDIEPKFEDRIKIEKFFGKTLELICKLDKIPSELLLENTNIAQEPAVSYTLNPLLRSRKVATNKPVKYYDTDFAAGQVAFYEDNVISPAYEMNIPAFAGCIAFNVFGDSMETLIKSGSIVFGRKVEDWQSFLEYGQIYGVVMNDERRFLKYIRKHKDSNLFSLKSENENYDTFEIPKNKIHNIWLIEGWMLKRT